MLYVLTNPGKNDDAFLENVFLPLQELERNQFSVVPGEWFNRLTEDDYGLEAVDLQDADEKTKTKYLGFIAKKEWVNALEVLLHYYSSGYINEYIQPQPAGCEIHEDCIDACVTAGMINVPVPGQKSVVIKTENEELFDTMKEIIIEEFDGVGGIYYYTSEDAFQLDVLLFDFEINMIISSLRQSAHDEFKVFCLYAEHYEQEEVPDNSILVIW